MFPRLYRHLILFGFLLRFHVAVDEWRNDQLLPVEASADAKKLERARKKRMQLQRQYKEARAEAESGGQRFPSTAAAKSKPSASPVSKPNNPRVVAAAAAAAAVGTQSATNMAAALDNSVRLLFLRHGEGDHNACKQVAGTWCARAVLAVRSGLPGVCAVSIIVRAMIHDVCQTFLMNCHGTAGTKMPHSQS